MSLERRIYKAMVRCVAREAEGNEGAQLPEEVLEAIGLAAEDVAARFAEAAGEEVEPFREEPLGPYNGPERELRMLVDQRELPPGEYPARIAEVRERIADGTYVTEAKLDVVTDKLLGELGGEQRPATGWSTDERLN